MTPSHTTSNSEQEDNSAMSDKRTAKLEQARNRVIAKGRAADFKAMNKVEFGAWIDDLPFEEFAALLHLHDEFVREGATVPPTEEVEIEPAAPKPDDNAWTVYVGEGAQPLPDDVQCFVLFPDGGFAGPNRADAFLWGGAGAAKILAFQLVGATP